MLISWAETKMHRLQKWIAASNWTAPFEEAKRKRLEDTGLWILEEREFKAWEANQLSGSDGDWGNNLLIITGRHLFYTFKITGNRFPC
jgi:hypothetical protein